MVTYRLSQGELARAELEGTPEGSGYISPCLPLLKHNTDIINL